MKRLPAPLLLLLPILLLLSTAPVASADEAPSADELLAKVDHAASDYKDLRFMMTMTVEGDGVKKQARLETFDKGGDKRLVRFLAPGDVKGMAVLMDGPNSMYIYLPQFQKVRRVAGHAKQQGFMDSDFSNDDMGVVKFTGTYTPSIVDQSGDIYKVKLVPKPEAESAYEALVISVDKKTLFTKEVEYWQGGKAVKKQTRSAPKQMTATYSTPTVIVMEDLTKAHKTTLTMEDIKMDSGIPDSTFTKQALERAR